MPWKLLKSYIHKNQCVSMQRMILWVVALKSEESTPMSLWYSGLCSSHSVNQWDFYTFYCPPSG